jgi:hypothetical protein
MYVVAGCHGGAVALSQQAGLQWCWLYGIMSGTISCVCAWASWCIRIARHWQLQRLSIWLFNAVGMRAIGLHVAVECKAVDCALTTVNVNMPPRQICRPATGTNSSHNYCGAECDPYEHVPA